MSTTTVVSSSPCDNHPLTTSVHISSSSSSPERFKLGQMIRDSSTDVREDDGGEAATLLATRPLEKQPRRWGGLPATSDASSGDGGEMIQGLPAAVPGESPTVRGKTPWPKLKREQEVDWTASRTAGGAGGICQFASADEMNRLQATMGTGLVSVGTAGTYDRPKEFPGFRNFSEWLLTRPTPIRDPFMREFPEDSKALLLALYFQALFEGSAASFKGPGLRDEQLVAVKSALLYHFRMEFDEALGGPIFDLSFFSNRVVKDMLTSCKRSEAEFHEYVVARKAAAKLPWCWWLMLVALKLYWKSDDEVGSWSTAKDIDRRGALLGFMFLFDVGVRPCSVTNPGPREADHCMTRGQGMAYLWVLSVADGMLLGLVLADDGRFPRLVGVVMGRDIWRMSRFPAFSVKRVAYADFQILSTKTIGAATSATGANPIPEPVTIARRSKMEDMLLTMIITWVIRVPGWDWEQFFTRTGVYPLGSEAADYFGVIANATRVVGRLTPKTGIRRLTSSDLSSVAKTAAKDQGLDVTAFSGTSGRKARATNAYFRSIPVNSSIGVPSANERGGNWTSGSTTPANFYAAKLHGEGEFALATDDQELEFAGREDTLRMLERRSENVKATQATEAAGALALADEEEDEGRVGGVTGEAASAVAVSGGYAPDKVARGRKPKASVKKSMTPGGPKKTPKAAVKKAASAAAVGAAKAVLQATAKRAGVTVAIAGAEGARTSSRRVTASAKARG